MDTVFNDDQILDSVAILESKQEVETLSFGKFFLLCFLSFGLYAIWWIYKQWRFFAEKEDLDIYPFWRTFFSIFYLTDLFKKILAFAKDHDWKEDFSPTSLFIGYIVINALSRLPDPFWMTSLILTPLIFISPLKAINYALEQSDDYQAVDKGFNYKQIIVLVLGTIFFCLVCLGLYVDDVQ